jgi:glycosyltransferase involved in cell wall biosynthesis
MDAAARFAAGRPAVRLRILGDGRRAGKIRRRADILNAGLGREVITVEGWVEDPREDMARSDVVLAAGRGVLEAVAAGRPAVVVGNDGIGGLLTGENYAELQKTNFSGRGSASAVTGESLAGLLALLPPHSPGDEKLRALVRRDHDAARLTAAILEIFQRALAGPAPDRPGIPGDLEEESAVPCSPD